MTTSLVDVNKAREYMKDKVEPVVGKLVQELAINQPEDVLEYILNFAARELESYDGSLTEEESKTRDTLAIEEGKSCYGDLAQSISFTEEQESEPSNRHQDRPCVETSAAEETKVPEIQALNTSLKTVNSSIRRTEVKTSPEAYTLAEEEDCMVGEDEGEGFRDEEAEENLYESKFEAKVQDEESHTDVSTKEAEEIPICCVSGMPAELQVRLPGSSRIEYYARDIYEAMKRKNKLRGAVTAELNEELPSLEDADAPLWEIDPEDLARIAAAKSVDEVANRPVTPPKRGFKMTRPGENYHDETRREGPINVGPVKFEAKALGKLDGEAGNDEDMRGAALDAAKRRQTELEKNSRLTDEQRAALNIKRKKDDLLGKIRAHYATLGGAEPIGLAASSVETLQRHLSKIKAHTAAIQVDRDKKARSLEKEDKLREKMLKNTSGEMGFPGTKPTRTLSFEPKAAGSISDNQAEDSQSDQGDTGSGANQVIDPESRRRRAAEAAARRFK